jgi:hypothetical protein
MEDADIVHDYGEAFPSGFTGFSYDKKKHLPTGIQDGWVSNLSLLLMFLFLAPTLMRCLSSVQSAIDLS